jgi:hypothetical protein
MLIAACIAGASLVALLPLYVSSCRTALAAAVRVPLSDRVTALLGADESELVAADFQRVLQLVRMCPEHGADREGIRAVTVYYRIVALCDGLFGGMAPRLNTWSENERRQCAHFAAVVLDRSISSSRRLFTQQASDQL